MTTYSRLKSRVVRGNNITFIDSRYFAVRYRREHYPSITGNEFCFRCTRYAPVPLRTHRLIRGTNSLGLDSLHFQIGARINTSPQTGYANLVVRCVRYK